MADFANSTPVPAPHVASDNVIRLLSREVRGLGQFEPMNIEIPERNEYWITSMLIHLRSAANLCRFDRSGMEASLQNMRRAPDRDVPALMLADFDMYAGQLAAFVEVFGVARKRLADLVAMEGAA